MRKVFWCIHAVRESDGALVKVQLHGPDDPVIMLREAVAAIAEDGGGYTVTMIHEEPESPMPEFDSAIENMIFQGFIAMKVIEMMAHAVYHQHKKED